MYDSPDHLPVFESLMGLQGHKPFECVGTADEVLAAMYAASKAHYGCGSLADSGAAGVAVGSGAAQRPLPLLFRKHGDLIRSKGKLHWAELQASVERANSGEWGVPNLYPHWYKLGN